mgnify:CR=1 FL=1
MENKVGVQACYLCKVPTPITAADAAAAAAAAALGLIENPYSSGKVGLPNHGSADPSDIIWKDVIPGKTMAPFLGPLL